MFRSPTAAAVIEVYRVAVGEFQPPKEMLTDNGRQYTTWRGVSRFEAELKKDREAHFKSRPQHPMTRRHRALALLQQRLQAGTQRLALAQVDPVRPSTITLWMNSSPAAASYP